MMNCWGPLWPEQKSIARPAWGASSSKDAKYKVVNNARVIENQKITETLTIDGEQWNGAIITKNTFIGQSSHGLHISNAQNITIIDNKFRNIHGNAIKLRSNQASGTDNITIKQNRFENIGLTTILAGEPNQHVSIVNNSFHNVATITSGNKQHGIYLKGPEFLVEGNTITSVGDAHGISVRTSGVVRGNMVIGATEDGIKYYSDSETKGTGNLLIENNIVVNCGHGGLVFAVGGGPLIDTVVVRFNTLVNNYRGIRIYQDLTNVSFQLYGNFVIEPGGKYTYFKTRPRVEQFNIYQQSTADFFDLANRDFRIYPHSVAWKIVPDTVMVPEYDYLNQPFPTAPFSAGAIQ